MTQAKSLLLFAGVGAALLFVAWHATREPVQSALVSRSAATAAAVAPNYVPTTVTAAPVASAAPSEQDVARWIADATGGDAAKRAPAIEALAGAPKSDALPVLRNVLINGEPQVDRPLALRSLRDLALDQGDDDGAIRDAVRAVIYHGDDLSPASDAQEVIEIIEESRMK